MKKSIVILIGLLLIVIGFYAGRNSVTKPAASSANNATKTVEASATINNYLQKLDQESKPDASATVAAESSDTPVGFVYVSNTDSTTVSKCPILDNLGTLGECQTTGSGFVAPLGMALSPDRRIVYVANGGNNSIIMCGISQFNGEFLNCTQTGDNFNQPTAIAYDIQKPFMFISNQDSNSITRCRRAKDNSLINCKTIVNDLSGPEDINFNPNYSYIYIANSNNSTIEACVIDPVTSSLTNCFNTGNDFSSPQSVTLASNGRFAYITNQLANTVSLCKIDQTSGALFNCNATGAGFHAPSDMALSSLGTIAFISNADSVSSCVVKSDGSLTRCREFAGNFNHSTGLRVKDDF